MLVAYTATAGPRRLPVNQSNMPDQSTPSNRTGSLPPESEWPALLAKYDRPVPRYTSYPPVPVWADDPDLARQRIIEAAVRDGLAAMYVHVPFCHAQ